MKGAWLSPKKAPGSDKIINRVLKEIFDILHNHSLILFQASINIGHFSFAGMIRQYNKCKTTWPADQIKESKIRTSTPQHPESKTIIHVNQIENRTLRIKPLLASLQHHQRRDVRLWTRNRDDQMLSARLKELREREERTARRGWMKEHEKRLSIGDLKFVKSTLQYVEKRRRFNFN